MSQEAPEYQRAGADPLAAARAVATAQARSIEKTIGVALALAEGIEDKNTAELANTELREIVAGRKNIEAARLGITRPMDAAKKAVMELFAPALDRLEQAEGTLRKALSAWTVKERERERDERIAAEKVAREKAAAEQEAAEKARREGNEAAAAAHEEAATTAVVTAAASVQTTAPLRGFHTQERWRAEVVDLRALVVAVAEGRAPIAYLAANMTALNQACGAMKAETQIPGVKAVSSSSSVVR